MYRKLLYQDDCILEVDTNKVFFTSDTGWEVYQQWQKDFPNEEERLLLDREALLRWNQGKENIKEGVRYLYHNSNGEIYKKEHLDINSNITRVEEFYESTLPSRDTTYTDIGKNVIVYNKDGKKVSEYTEMKNGISVLKKSIEYFPSGKIYRKELVKLVGTRVKVLNRIQYEKDIIVTQIRTLGNITINHKFNLDGNLHSTYYTVDDSDYMYKKYWPGTKDIFTLYKKKDNGFEYQEYFANGNLRGIGTLTSNKKMDGAWVYYHINGGIESTHFFNNGKLTNESRLYFEDGKLNNTFKHD